MFFLTVRDKYEDEYATFLRKIREALLSTYEQQRKKGYTHASIAAELGVHRSVVSKRLAGSGNMTLRTLCDVFVAMGRHPLENFEPTDAFDECLCESAKGDYEESEMHSTVIQFNVFTNRDRMAGWLQNLIEREYTSIANNTFDLGVQSYFQNGTSNLVIEHE